MSYAGDEMSETEKRSEMLTFRCTPLEAHLVRAVAAADHKTVSGLLLDLAAERAKRLLGPVAHPGHASSEASAASVSETSVSDEHGRAENPH